MPLADVIDDETGDVVYVGTFAACREYVYERFGRTRSGFALYVRVWGAQ